MTYGGIKRAVLELINQYSVAGAVVPLSYNNQADYTGKIPRLINAALLEIRDTVPAVTLCRLSDGETADGVTRFRLPDDFQTLRSGGVWKNGERTNHYRIMGRQFLCVSARDADGYSVEYYQRPRQLPGDPADEYDLIEDPDVMQCAVTYAAAHLVMMEDEFVYATLNSEYETKLMRLKPPLTAEVEPIQDCCFGGGGIYGDYW